MDKRLTELMDKNLLTKAEVNYMSNHQGVDYIVKTWESNCGKSLYQVKFKEDKETYCVVSE